MPRFFKRTSSSGGPAAKRVKTTHTTYSRSFTKSRRRTRRGRRRGRSVVYTKIMKMPVPDRILTKLRYVEMFSLSPTAAGTPGMVSYSFRTSIHDPDYTGLGHQPLWHDTMQTMYGRYRVNGMKYRFTVMNTNTSQLSTLAIEHADGAPQLPAVGFNTILERRSVRTVNLGPSAARPTVVRGYLATGKPWGLTKTDFHADEEFEANFNTNPAKMSHVNIYCVTQNTSAIINIQATIDYYCEFNKRALIGGS